MAILKRGARRIVVDGNAYRWNVRRSPTYSQGNGWSPVTLAVELIDGQSILIAEMPQAHAKSWTATEPIPVLPADVARAIRGALAAGWQPAKPGSPFEYRETEFLSRFDDVTGIAESTGDGDLSQNHSAAFVAALSRDDSSVVD